MTITLFGMHLSISIRNGVGFDIEATSSRPVWVTSSNFVGTKACCLNGLVLLLPFIIITFGNIYDLEEEYE